MDKKYIQLDQRINELLPVRTEESLFYLNGKYKTAFKFCFRELIAKPTSTTADGVFAEISPLFAKDRNDLFAITIDELEDNIVHQTWTFIEKDKGRFSVSRYFFTLCFKFISKSRRDILDSYGETYYPIFLNKLKKLRLGESNTLLAHAINYAENEIDYLVKENEYVSLIVYYLMYQDRVRNRAKMCDLWPSSSRL